MPKNPFTFTNFARSKYTNTNWQVKLCLLPIIHATTPPSIYHEQFS